MYMALLEKHQGLVSEGNPAVLGPFPEHWQAVGPCLDEALRLSRERRFSWSPSTMKENMAETSMYELFDSRSRFHTRCVIVSCMLPS